jgi:hypothetical protein
MLGIQQYLLSIKREPWLELSNITSSTKPNTAS